MKEYKINDDITLKLEKNKTVIYVKGERFMQCKYLLLINPHEKQGQLEIESIDEATDKLSTKLEQELNPLDLGITPKEEFWGHCSNIQAWVENNYDTRLLHRNLAFFLLLELAEKGNKKAEMIFKEEVAKRLSSGNPNIIGFLVEQGYDSYLSDEEFLQCVLDLEEVEVILNLESILGIDLVPVFWTCNKSGLFLVKDSYVREIDISGLNLEYFSELLEKLKFLERINLSNNNLKNISIHSLKKLKNLRELNLRNNPLSKAERERIKKLRPELTLI